MRTLVFDTKRRGRGWLCGATGCGEFTRSNEMYCSTRCQYREQQRRSRYRRLLRELVVPCRSCGVFHEHDGSVWLLNGRGEQGGTSDAA